MGLKLMEKKEVLEILNKEEIGKFEKKDIEATDSSIIVKSFPTSKHCGRRLLSQTRINPGFFKKCSSRLKKSILDEFIPATLEMRYIKVGNEIDDIYVGDGELPPIKDVFEKVDSLTKGQSFQHFTYDPYNHTINLITTHRKDAGVNDISHSGLTIDLKRMFSRASLMIASYLFRLSCTNGMGITERNGSFELGGGWEAEINANVPILLSQAQERLQKFVELKNHKVTDATQVIHRIAREQRISQSIVSKIMDQVPSLPQADVTMYDIVNLITSYANEMENPRRARRLQFAPGNWMATTNHLCSHCHRPLN